MSVRTIFKKVTLLIFIMAIALLSYCKGYNDHRIKALAKDILFNYASLKQLDDGNSILARSNLYVVISGDNEAYRHLSKNILLNNPATSDPELAGQLKQIDVYIKEHPEKYPEK
jgi:hypothetical protein